MPQLSPHHHFLPRCRAMMFPGRTCSPPNFLRPRNLGLESRPLDEEPPCFLDAKRTNAALHAGRVKVSGRPGRGEGAGSDLQRANPKNIGRLAPPGGKGGGGRAARGWGRRRDGPRVVAARVSEMATRHSA